MQKASVDHKTTTSATCIVHDLLKKPIHHHQKSVFLTSTRSSLCSAHPKHSKSQTTPLSSSILRVPRLLRATHSPQTWTFMTRSSHSPSCSALSSSSVPSPSLDRSQAQKRTRSRGSNVGTPRVRVSPPPSNGCSTRPASARERRPRGKLVVRAGPPHTAPLCT